ncbi:MAG: EpsI family protein [Thermodesulfovibrionia bacterium]|nr:EpsI family protein [Thermodesulfovibrionia bacterium]
MNRNTRFILVTFLLTASILFSFTFPNKATYEGARLIAGLEMPDAFAGWKGVDMSEQFRANLQGAGYEFISESLAYRYSDIDERSLLFLIINARDFHYPNACLTSSGIEVKEMDNTELNASGRIISAYTLLTDDFSERDKTLILYWIVIDKKLVTNWAEQKVKQLYFSLFDKNNVGLLVRLDIPVEGDDYEQGLALAHILVNDLSGAMSDEEADHIFGKNN